MLLVLSGPSGAGKSTLKHMVMAHDGPLVFSVSATTRPPRPGEKEGEDYFFLSEGQFEEHVRSGDFLEHTALFGSRYGTLRQSVEKVLASGQDMIMDISAEGGRCVHQAFPAECVRVLVLPPSLDILAARLSGRENGATAATLSQRLEEARHEIRRCKSYDYVIVNGDVAMAARDLGSIIQAERHRMGRHPTLWEDLFRTNHHP